MRELSIGQVARAAGIAASALRYYEKAGLVPPPPRKSRQRRYDESIFGRLELIRLALDAGFTIRETRTLLSVPLPEPCGLRAIPQRGAAAASGKGCATSMRAVRAGIGYLSPLAQLKSTTSSVGAMRPECAASR